MSADSLHFDIYFSVWYNSQKKGAYTWQKQYSLIWMEH